MLRRRFRESVLLLLVGARRELLCASARSPQTHGGREHRHPSKTLQTWIFPSHLRILMDQRPDATVSPTIPNERRGARIDIIWSLAGPGPQPGICLLGSCRRDICPRDICRPAQPRAEAEAVGGRQQLLFPRRLEKRRRGSRI